MFSSIALLWLKLFAEKYWPRAQHVQYSAAKYALGEPLSKPHSFKKKKKRKPTDADHFHFLFLLNLH